MTKEDIQLQCDFHTGTRTYSSGSKNIDPFLATIRDMNLVAIHEAGHAVVQVALGFGCLGISLTEIDLGDGTFGLDGTCFPKKDRNRRLARRVFGKGILDDSAYAYGVTVAAGPAAERKYRLSDDIPFDAPDTETLFKFAAENVFGDEQAIEFVAKALEVKSNHDRRAYQEEVWRRAKQAMENETIWNAVENLSGELSLAWGDGQDEDGTVTILGPRVRRIVRQSGVVPGMLGYRNAF
jgi:hypothetical protein